MRACVFIVSIFVTYMFCACGKQAIDLVPGSVYAVTTTEGEGFASFEHTADNQWKGVYYLCEGKLMADRKEVFLKVGKELILEDNTGKQIPLLRYEKYEEPIFHDYSPTWTYQDSAYTVTSQKDVVYGHARGYWTSYPDTGGTIYEIFEARKSDLDQGERELELTMDVFQPNDDKDASRPLLVLIHGGAFFNGDKTDLGFPTWAQSFASMGYVVASVNYRLGFKKNITSVKRAGFRAVQDVDAAIRYLVHHKNIYGIDSERIFVAGTSAGAITALNVAFMRNENRPSEVESEGEIQSINPEMKESYNIRAIGNLWGAVDDLSMLDNAPASVISFHSTYDPVVPFGKGYPFTNIFLNWLFFPTMYGSAMITDYLGSQRAVLKSYDLPERHTLHIDEDVNGEKTLNSRFYEIEAAMRDYFSSTMLPSPITVRHTHRSQTFSVTSPDLDSVFWCVEGGALLKNHNSRVDVLLFPDAPSHSVTVCGKYKSGLTFRHRWNL